MYKSGRCSTIVHFGSIWTWFLSARRRVTYAHTIFSSTSKDFADPSIVKTLTNSFWMFASRIFSIAILIFSAFALVASSYNNNNQFLHLNMTHRLVLILSLTCPFCGSCKVCGLLPLPPLLADDSLDSIETVSLKAESLSGESVRPESVLRIISVSEGSSLSRLPLSDESARVWIRDTCWVVDPVMEFCFWRSTNQIIIIRIYIFWVLSTFSYLLIKTWT